MCFICKYFYLWIWFLTLLTLWPLITDPFDLQYLTFQTSVARPLNLDFCILTFDPWLLTRDLWPWASDPKPLTQNILPFRSLIRNFWTSISIPWPPTHDLWPATSEPWPLMHDLWPATSDPRPLTQDLWPKTSDLLPWSAIQSYNTIFPAFSSLCLVLVTVVEMSIPLKNSKAFTTTSGGHEIWVLLLKKPDFEDM